MLTDENNLEMTNDGPGIGEKVARNSATSILRAVLSLPIAFFIVPYTLKVLGPEQYGIWALVGILSTYVRLGDFGIGTAVVKYVAEYTASGDTDRINTLVSTAMVFYLLAVTAMVVPLLLLREPIVAFIFKVPTQFRGEAAFIFGWAALIHGFRMIFNIYNCVLYGLQRIDLSNTLALIHHTVNALMVWGVLAAGWGLRGLVIANAFAALILGLMTWIATHRVMPGLLIRLNLFKREVLKHIFRYSLNVQVSSLSNLALTPLSKLIITQVAGVEAVAFYDVADQIIAQARAFFAQAALTLLPAASELQATRGNRAVSRAYGTALRYLLLIALPTYAFIFVIARPFMGAWLGGGFDISAMALQILTVATFISVCVVPIYVMLQGIGLTQFTMLISLETGILSALLSLTLGSFFGFQGIVSGMALAMSLTAVHTFWLFRSKVGFRASQLLQAVSVRSLTLVGAMVAALGLILRILGDSPKMISLILIGVGYVGLYGLGLILFRILTPEDLRPARQLMPGRVYQGLMGWLA